MVSQQLTLTRKHLCSILATSLATVAVLAAAAPSAAPSAAGALNLRFQVQMLSNWVECSPPAPSEVSACRARTGTGVVSGLGSVSEAYTWQYWMGPPTCPPDVGKPLATTGRLVVAGKGELHFAVADGARCVDIEPLRNEPQDFTITGGDGIYQGASGSGTLERSLSGGRGIEQWTGTLTVPGVEFDLTPPRFRGARSTTVRAPKGAKRVRVTYLVSASDDVDGQVPVSCTPRSGSRFKVGRTPVTCRATDTSANTQVAKFRITVKRRR